MPSYEVTVIAKDTSTSVTPADTLDGALDFAKDVVSPDFSVHIKEIPDPTCESNISVYGARSDTGRSIKCQRALNHTAKSHIYKEGRVTITWTDK